MAYDTSSRYPWNYAQLMEDSVIRFSKGINNTAGTKLMVGVPVYEDFTFAHIPAVENLKTALIGIKKAMSSPSCKTSVILGIAPFAEYCTDEAKWAIYNRYWLGEQSRQ